MARISTDWFVQRRPVGGVFTMEEMQFMEILLTDRREGLAMVLQAS